jgi:hypothetical protein
MTDRQRAIRGTTANQTVAGYWRIIITTPSGLAHDVSMFRGIPVTIGDFAFSDPFGALSMSLEFPQITIFDRLGDGDLDWAVKGSDLDVQWEGDLPPNYPFGTTINGVWTPSWRWEGYLTTFNWASEAGSGSMSIQAKGCGYQMDNFLAKPEYLTRPLPYEVAIARQFSDKTRPSLQLQQMKITFPSWWQTKYTPVAGAPGYMVPSGVNSGDNWTGLVTRATGSWDPVLTSYIQQMLSSMYTRRGRWTIDFVQNRQPVMFHRDYMTVPDAATVVIDPVLPDVSINLSEDWEQSLTTVYGQGSSLSGVSYTGMQVSLDGTVTSYAPLAANHQVYPTQASNGWLNKRVMAKEVSIQMQTGLDPNDAAQVGRAHLAMFSDPGLTGTITLGVDPIMNGRPLPRHLVRAGMSIHIPGLFGRMNGVLLHVVSSNHSLDKTTLTVDSKFRDALTVNEARLRGKDSLSVNRMLVGGGYTPPITDQLVPWNYANGSGYLPLESLRLFRGMPADTTFPWESWTTSHPPSSASWGNCYIKVGKTTVPNVAANNWAAAYVATNQKDAAGKPLGKGYALPIRVSQAGTARMLQIAAYDVNGRIMRVPFHVSLYTMRAANTLSMPQIPADQAAMFPPYKAGDKYPYVRDGWEQIKADGTKDNPQIPHPTDSVGLIRAWGTFYDKAGFYPGSYASGDQPTGMMIDENQWSWDLTGILPFNFMDSAAKNQAKVGAGMVYLMVYCDAQGPTQDVYFAGRIFRVEPTSNSGGS